MKQLALFDFDGTITTRDTLLEIAKFSTSTSTFLVKMLLFLPVFASMKVKLVRAQNGKERFLRLFFGRQDERAFNSLCSQFAAQKVPHLLRPQALSTLTALKEEGNHVVIVSASPENWIRPWAEPLGIDVISTKLRFENDRFIGISGTNCNGEEKVRRIKETLNIADYDKVIAYGDTKGDHPMLALADEKHYKPFR